MKSIAKNVIKIFLGVGLISFLAMPMAFAASVLNGGEQLTANQFLLSSDQRWKLIMQGDGNLVLYTESDMTPVWASGTVGNPGAFVVMQGDGNLVVYSPSWSPLWASGTVGNPGAHLVMQDDRNAVIYSSSGVALWATGTVYTPPPPNPCHVEFKQAWGGSGAYICDHHEGGYGYVEPGYQFTSGHYTGLAWQAGLTYPEYGYCTTQYPLPYAGVLAFEICP